MATKKTTPKSKAAPKTTAARKAAPKKAAPKKAAPKKEAPSAETPANEKPNVSMVRWEDRMAAAAARQAAAEKPVTKGVPRISIRGGILSVDGEAVEGNEMEVVVLAAVHANEYYTTAYVADTPTVPVCYAFSDPDSEDPEGEMEPHEEAEEPHNEDCASCPMNEWGSAETGRGKACRNTRRLALIPADALESVEALEEAEVRILTVSPTNIKNWQSYVQSKLVPLGVPSFGAVTRIKVSPDQRSMFRLDFAATSRLDFSASPELAEALFAKVDEAGELATRPFPKQSELDARREEEEKTRPKGRGPRKFAKKR